MFELVVAGVGIQRALFGFDGGRVSRRQNDIQGSEVPVFACLLSTFSVSKGGHREQGLASRGGGLVDASRCLSPSRCRWA